MTCLQACAPDAYTNVKATGFNGFFKTIQVQCSPLLLGGQEMSWALQAGAGDNNYSYFLDQTSRLYYQKIGPSRLRRKPHRVLRRRVRPRHQLHHRQVACGS